VLLTEPLFWGVLLRRWQRFLAEVRLESGEVVVAHVPNSGRLTGVAVPGNRCLLARICRGKLGYRVEVVEAGEVLVGINTLRANALAEEALEAGVLRLEGLAAACRVLREKSPVPGSRFDLCLEDASGPYWLEVKNVTLVEGGVGLFPDAVTARGAKHLRLLAAQARAGVRAGVVYVVQRGDARAVRAAEAIDPQYAQAAAEAAACGVRFFGVAVEVAPPRLVPHRPLPVL
jgi:sugar fermentation stimulation protein A